MQINQKTEGEMLSIFCFDTISTTEAFRNIVQQNFGKEVMTSLQELGEVLKNIHNRLISEGYVFNGGKYYKSDII